MSNALYKTNQEIPQDMLLGNLLFTNLIDMKIPVSDLTNIFKSNNIPESYVRAISQADAFRRASSSIKNRVMYMYGEDGYKLNGPNSQQKVRIEVDEVRNDVDSIKRIIGIKKVDEAQEDIKYEPIAQIIFNRTNGTCVGTPTVANTHDDFAAIMTLCQEVEDKYDDWSVYHNKDTVRNIINRIISDTHPVNLMPTGLCKFIPQASRDMLYNLKEALTEMNQYYIGPNVRGANIMEIIPVIDTDDQRELIEKNFTAEITDELFGFTQELKDVLAKRQTLSTRSAAAYIDKFNLLKAKAKEYESLLGIYVDAIHQQIKDSLDLVDANVESD